MIEGAIASKQGRHAEALDSIRAGIQLADLCLLRLHLGKAYFEAGRYIEALDEFQVAFERRGEAAAAFLDERPTWRYVAELKNWLSRARSEMRMTSASASD